MKPDTPKEDKPPNKGQAESTHVYTLPLKEDNLSTKDKMAGPEGVLVQRVHYKLLSFQPLTFLWYGRVVPKRHGAQAALTQDMRRGAGTSVRVEQGSRGSVGRVVRTLGTQC